jgi:hypothetical protein
MNTPAYKRLASDAKQKNERINYIANHSRHDENIDPVTGRPYFRPVTGRSPKNRPVDAKFNLGEHLYNNHKMIQEKHNKLKKDEELKLAE